MTRIKRQFHHIISGTTYDCFLKHTSMTYSVDTAIQKHPGNKWQVTLYVDGLWRTSCHTSLEEARNAVRYLLSQFEGKIGY